MIVMEFVHHETSVSGLGSISIGSVEHRSMDLWSGQSRSADPLNSTINLLCPKVGTMSEVEVLKATAPMAPSIGYDWLVMNVRCVEADKSISRAVDRLKIPFLLETGSTRRHMGWLGLLRWGGNPQPFR